MRPEDSHTIGILLPSNNSVLAPELTSVVPPSFSFEWRRLTVASSAAEDVKEMASRAAAHIDDLISPAIDRYVYACVASTLASPPGWEPEFAARLTALSGRPCTTAMSATMRAVVAVGGHRITLLTPYPVPIHALAVDYVQHGGLEVVSSATLDIRNLTEVGRCRPEDLEAAALDALTDDADALCILATDLPTFGSILRLEITTGKPVVTTNQAIAWALLSDVERSPSMMELGRLLTIA
jgi:maleate isomerase